MTREETQPFLLPELEDAGHTTMRCVSLWQPWASLVACGIKATETRSRPAPSTILGRRIGIQAAGTTRGFHLVQDNPSLWEECLARLPWSSTGDLPRGFLIATALVEASIPVERLTADPYGDYTPGRFGWLLTDIRPLAEPFPLKGAQGIFFARIPTKALPA